MKTKDDDLRPITAPITDDDTQKRLKICRLS